MKVLAAVTFDALLGLFGRDHPYDPDDEANSNHEAEGHLRNAELTLGGRWHHVLLEGSEVLDIVLPWHLGEGGEVELIPKTGLTVAAAAARLGALGTSYAGTNPLCGIKLAHQTQAEPKPLFLSTRPVPGPDYEEMTIRQGLIHLDGLHRMLAWQLAGQLVPGRWVQAYIAGLSPTDVGHGARHDQDRLDVHPNR